MASAHVIEVGEITAGIVVREHGGFRFFASELAFCSLEGAMFRTADQAARAARERLKPRKTPSHVTLTQRRRSDAQEPAGTPMDHARAGSPQRGAAL